MTVANEVVILRGVDSCVNILREQGHKTNYIEPINEFICSASIIAGQMKAN